MATWAFWCIDNSGKRQSFRVKAASKADAIKKGMERARKNAAGDIWQWDCKLVSA